MSTSKSQKRDLIFDTYRRKRGGNKALQPGEAEAAREAIDSGRFNGACSERDRTLRIIETFAAQSDGAYSNAMRVLCNKITEAPISSVIGREDTDVK